MPVIIPNITYGLLATLIWESGTKLSKFFTDPLRKALRETEKEFKGKSLPFPVSRIEAIIGGSGNHDRIEVFKQAEKFIDSRSLASSILDFENSSLKEVPENIEITIQFVESFKNSFIRYLSANEKYAHQAQIELQKIAMHTNQEDHSLMSNDLHKMGSAIDLIKQSVDNIGSSAQTVSSQNEILTEGLHKIQIEQANNKEQLAAFPNIFHKILEESLRQYLPIRSTDIYSGSDSIEIAINNEIDAYRDLIKEKPRTALSLYDTLKKKYWKTASNRIKFRIITNIGACYMMLCKNDTAAEHFFSAETYSPDSPKALRNAALAHLLLGNPEYARKKAKQAIVADPDDVDGYSILLTSYPDDKIIDDYQSLVPPDKWDSAPVAYSIGHAFRRKRMHDQACFWFRRSYEKDSSLQMKQAYAISIIEGLFSDPMVLRGMQVNAESKSKLNHARKLLEEIWVGADTEFKPFLSSIGLNLLSIYLFIGEDNLSAKLFEEMFQVAPDNVQVREMAAFNLLSSGRYKEALEQFEYIPRGCNVETDLAYIEALIGDKKIQKALTHFETINIPPDNSYLISVAESIRLTLTFELFGKEEAVKAAERIEVSQDRDTELLMSVALMYRKTGETDRAERLILNTASKLTDDNDYKEKLRVADTLFSFRKFKQAMIFYRKLLTTYSYSHILKNLLTCYLNTEQRKEIEEILSKMDTSDRLNPEIRRFEVYFNFKIGNLDLCREGLDQLISETPDDLHLRLNWIVLLHYQNEDDSIIRFLENCSDYSDADPEDRIKLAQYFHEYGYFERCLKLGYELCKLHPRSQTITLKYIQLILMGNFPEGLIECKSAGPHAAITLRDGFGEQKTIIIEEEGIVFLLEEEISPSHQLSRTVKGKSKGDTFDFRVNHFQESTFEIIDIKSKYIYLAHKRMETYNSFFPEKHGFYPIKIGSDKDGNPDLSFMLKTIDRRHEHATEIREAYEKSKYPIGVVANLLGVNPLQAWIGFMNPSFGKLFCSTGVKEERDRAIEILKQNKGKCIIDPLSLYTAFSLGIIDDLHVKLGRFGIVHSTLRLYREQIDELKSSSPFISTSKIGNTYTKEEITNERIMQGLEHFQNIYDWACANCDIIPAVGKSDIDPKLAKITDSMHPCFLDSLMATNGSDRILISDDLHLRLLGKDLLGCEGTWIEPAMFVCVESHAMHNSIYAKAVAGLINCNMTFIAVMASTLILLAKLDEWSVSETFRRVAETLGKKETNLSSAIEVFKDFFILLEQENDGLLQIEPYSYAMLNGIRAWRDPQILSRFDNLIFKRPFTKKHFRNSIISWANGHFLVEVE